MVRSQPVDISILFKNGALFGLTKLGGGCGERAQHGLQFEGRAADDLEHVGGCRLLLQRLAKLAEETRVFGRDHGLGREIRQQINLFLAKWCRLPAVNRKRTHELIVLEHWHIEDCSELSKIDRSHEYGFALNVSRLLGNVGDVNRLSGLSNAPQGRSYARALRSAEPEIGKRRRHPEHRGGMPVQHRRIEAIFQK